MTSKLKIRIGQIEFEYEGETNFDQPAIKDLVSHLESICRTAGPAGSGLPASTLLNGNASGEALPEGAIEALSGKAAASTEALSHPSTVASTLSASSGPHLVMAAAAYLQLGQNKPTFTRTELLAAMKAATAHYQENYSGNLTKTLKRLTLSKQLNQVGQNTYSIPLSERQKIEARLVG